MIGIEILNKIDETISSMNAKHHNWVLLSSELSPTKAQCIDIFIRQRDTSIPDDSPNIGYKKGISLTLPLYAVLFVLDGVEGEIMRMTPNFLGNLAQIFRAFNI